MRTHSKKRLSACCEKPAKVNMASEDGHLFCSHCGEPCEESVRKAPFRGYSTLSTTRKATGEGDAFKQVWARCKGLSEVSGEKLLPPDHPMWTWQFSHLIPKGSYQKERNNPENIVAVTVDEHTKEWPLVKEKTDDELRSMKQQKWMVVVTLFRALRLRYNVRLNAELSGKG